MAAAPKYPLVKAAEGYARQVIAGKIPACKWIKLLCKKHLAELKASKAADFPYSFDPAKAERVAKFLQLLPHTKGKWAGKKELVKLEPWQIFSVCIPFGWVRKKDGTRRFRTILVFVPRKNGKSIIGGGVGLYMLTADGEFGAEVYSGATTEKQAWEVFRPAKLMVERTPALSAKYGVDGHNTGNIVTCGNAQCNGQDRYPVYGNKLCFAEVGISAMVQQIVGDNHSTNWRNRCRQKCQPTDKVIVKPQCAQCADNTVSHRQRTAGKAGNIGKSQT